MEAWKKHWIKFAISATVNAGVFIAYRIYIHKQNKEAEDKELKVIKNNKKVEKDLRDGIYSQTRKAMKPNLKIHKKKSDQ